jgi:hypothetical protein
MKITDPKFIPAFRAEIMRRRARLLAERAKLPKDSAKLTKAQLERLHKFAYTHESVAAGIMKGKS